MMPSTITVAASTAATITIRGLLSRGSVAWGSPGVFSWGGAYHTVYWADPKEKLVAVLMTQLLPANGSDLNDKFRVLVYQTVVGPPPTTLPARK